MRLIPLALAMLLFAATASAQSTATLQGMVTDAQKAAVPGVAVTIRNEATGAERWTAFRISGASSSSASPRPSHLTSR